MRKSFGLALVGAVAIAGVVALVVIWLPARHAREDRTWQAAGRHALTTMTLPALFRPTDANGRPNRTCGDGPFQRCFVASGDPRANLFGVRTALSPAASGPIRETCQPTLLVNSPETCSLQIPVPGSRLVVDLFARGVTSNQPGFTYQGTYVLVHVDNR